MTRVRSLKTVESSVKVAHHLSVNEFKLLLNIPGNAFIDEVLFQREGGDPLCIRVLYHLSDLKTTRPYLRKTSLRKGVKK